MSRFVKTPNLPEGKADTLICGSDDKHILNFFARENIRIIKNEKNPCVDPAISFHADISALHLGGRRLLIDKKQERLKNELVLLGCEVFDTEEEIKGAYPGDVKLNFTIAGEYAVGNFTLADSRLPELIRYKKKLNVKQGYSKCSTLVVRENALITDDPSIHRVASENGFDSLLISKGDIRLSGHEYGFIGGASGKISPDAVVFFGDILKHRDFEKIKAFLLKHGCDYVCTDKRELRDIGGIVVLTENE